MSRSDTICTGSPATFTLQGTPGAILKYVTSSGPDTGSVTLTGSLQEVQIPNISENTTIRLTRIQFLEKNTVLDTAIQIIVRNQPVFSILPLDSVFCAGQQATLSLQQNPGEISGIVWQQIASGPSYNFTPVSDQVVGVQVMDRFGCTYQRSKKIVVNQFSAGITAFENSGRSGDNILGSGDAVRLVASGGTGYAWSTGATTGEITVSPTATTLYRVFATNNAGCRDTAEIRIVSNPALSVSEIVRNTCSGASTGAIALSPGAGTPGYSYLWSNGQSSGSIENLAAGSYQVEVQDAIGCAITRNFSISDNIPAPVLEVSVPQALCSGTPVAVGLQPSEAMRIRWSIDQFGRVQGYFGRILSYRVRHFRREYHAQYRSFDRSVLVSRLSLRM